MNLKLLSGYCIRIWQPHSVLISRTANPKSKRQDQMISSFLCIFCATHHQHLTGASNAMIGFCCWIFLWGLPVHPPHDSGDRWLHWGVQALSEAPAGMSFETTNSCNSTKQWAWSQQEHLISAAPLQKQCILPTGVLGLWRHMKFNDLTTWFRSNASPKSMWTQKTGLKWFCTFQSEFAPCLNDFWQELGRWRVQW